MDKVKITPLSIVPGYEEVATAASKLIRDNKISYDGGLNNAAISGGVEHSSQMIGEAISNNEDMLEMFPELTLASQVLASNILSPKDMLSVTFLYKFNTKLFSQEVQGALLSVIKEELESHYKLTSSAGKILEDIILTKGSNIKAIIPENALDSFINKRDSEFLSTTLRTHESALDFVKKTNYENERPLGFFGSAMSDKAFASIENATDAISPEKIKKAFNVGVSSNTFITDNYTFLTRQVTSSIKSDTVSDFIIAGQMNRFAGGSKKTKESATDSVFKRISRSYSAVSEISHDGERESVGRPLILDLPPESVIVIHRPGSPDDIIAHLVIATDEGYPVTKELMRAEMNDAQREGVKKGTSMGAYLTKKAKTNLFGKSDCIDFREATHLYGIAQEKDLLNTFKSSVYGDNIVFGNSGGGIYSLMLARAIKNSNSRLVFLPKEIVSYMALDRYSNGIGKSVLDGLQKINGLKATLMLANVTKEVTNSIGMTKVKMNVDPKDPDPFKTVQRGRQLILSTSAGMLPTSAKNFNDYATWSRQAGIFLEYEGHPKLPDVKFDFTNVSTNAPTGDIGFIERLNDQSIMAFGLTPEMVEESSRTDFATSITSRNSLLAKRVLLSQSTLMECYTDRGQKICRYDQIIYSRCKKIIEESVDATLTLLKESKSDEYDMYERVDKSDLVDIFYSKGINSLEISLPSPDVGADAKMAREFSDYKASLEDSVPAWISKESAKLISEESNLETLETLIIENKLRKWMMDRGYMPELFDLAHASTLSDTDQFDEMFQYTKKMIDNASKVGEESDEDSLVKPDEEKTDDVDKENDTVDDDTVDSTGDDVDKDDVGGDADEKDKGAEGDDLPEGDGADSDDTKDSDGWSS